MEVLLAIVVGALFAAGFYLLMRRHAVQLVIGLVLLTHAANLLLFVAGGLTRGAVPIVPEPHLAPFEPVANPLVQAMILTAIVIGMAVQVFVLALMRAAVAATGSGDVAEMNTTEP